ncbi:MAG: SUMF1/EgtB/PvdO family nonheme iron enzyme [Polyangiaceae bacterium]
MHRRAYQRASWGLVCAAVVTFGGAVVGPLPARAAKADEKLREPGPSAKRRPATSKGDEAPTLAKGTKVAAKEGKRAKAEFEVKKPRRWGKCPGDMVTVAGFCIDRYEAYVAEILPGGKLKKHSPFEPVNGLKNIKALNKRGRMPQAYISRNEAEIACHNAGKRLCTDEEWLTACKGPKPTTWPYGKEHEPGRCNDRGVSAFNLYFGKGEAVPQSLYTYENLNDPRLNRAEGTCAPSGKFKRCKNSYKVYDMVGNLHEWTATPSGTFRGGYYLDVHKHGDGCDYRTTAHNGKYHDYSTGFRCCADR